MFKKAFFLALFAFMALPATVAAKRAPITFAVTPDATVADLLISTHKKHTGLNLPRCPEFSSRWFWQQTPAKMSRYAAFFELGCGLIPTAAFIRFIKESPVLFEDAAIKHLYKKSLADFIAATKKYRARRTKKNLEALRTKEAVVISFLKHLELQNPLIRAKTARIFSTPKHGFFKRFLNSLILPLRSRFKAKPGTKGKKLCVAPNFLFIPVAATAINTAAVYGLFRFAFGENIALLPTAIMAYKALKAFNNDEKLTREPYEGIKVAIQLDEDPCCDASASQTGQDAGF